MKHIVKTGEELLAASERSEQVRGEIRRAGITMTELAYFAGTSAQTVHAWIRTGLTKERYMILLSAIGRARAAAEGR